MDNRWQSATQIVLNDGINSAFRPDQIGKAQAAWGSNITIRDGNPRTRDYAFVQRAILPKGLVQGAGYFSADDGMFILSIWGQLWRLLVTGNSVTLDLIPLDTPNSPLLPLAFMCETAGSFLVQDGQSSCIIYDGSVTRRAKIGEVPLGKQMAYGNGRLAVAVNDNTVKVGDITSAVFQSELNFTETTYLSGGGSFLFAQPVRGLAFLPVNNTNTGFGSLIVLGDRFVNSLGLQITSRALWDQIPGFEQILLPGIGTAAHDAVVGVNQDLYWRDLNSDIWSLRSAQWDALSPGNSPISREVSRITDFETDTLNRYSSGIFFNNRLLFLASPFYNRFGYASFSKIISMDASPLATMRGKSPPVYDGETIGLNFVRLFKGTPSGVTRAFAISTDDDGENRLWEIVPTNIADSSFLSNGTAGASITTDSPISGYYESRRFNFNDDGSLKRLMRVDVWPCEMQGPVTLSVYFRADNRSMWQLIDTVQMNAQMTNNPGQWVQLEAQERGQIKSFSLPDTIDGIDQKLNQIGFGFQVRVAWTGFMMVDRIKLWYMPVPETTYSDIGDMAAGPVQNIIANNVLGYSIPVGGLGGAYTDQNGNIYVDGFQIVYTSGP